MSHCRLSKLIGGIPQEARLGPILLAVIANDLPHDYCLRTNYVDDLTVLEVVPRNSPSLLGYVISEVQRFAINSNSYAVIHLPARFKTYINL